MDSILTRCDMKSFFPYLIAASITTKVDLWKDETATFDTYTGNSKMFGDLQRRLIEAAGFSRRA
jgi:hypothetical protein